MCINSYRERHVLQNKAGILPQPRERPCLTDLSINQQHAADKFSLVSKMTSYFETFQQPFRLQSCQKL